MVHTTYDSSVAFVVMEQLQTSSHFGVFAAVQACELLNLGAELCGANLDKHASSSGTSDKGSAEISGQRTFATSCNCDVFFAV